MEKELTQLIASESVRIAKLVLSECLTEPEARGSANVYASILLTVCCELTSRLVSLSSDPDEMLTQYLRVIDDQIRKLRKHGQ